MAYLIFACCTGDIGEVKKLLKNGVDINFKDYYGDTALTRASIMGYTEIVKLLLNYEKQKVDIYHKNNLTHNANCLALRFGHTEIVKLLNNYEYFRKNIKEFIPSYNILLSILIRNRRKHTFTYTFILPSEIILLIKEYGIHVCGKELFR